MDKNRIQFDKINGLGSQKLMYVVITMAVLITNVAILLNIPFLRQIFGFLFLAFLPGLLILQILKLNKIGSTEKFVLSVGLSIAFLMFFGLLINNLSLSLGYKTPLSTISLLISFNLAFILIAIIGYKVNKESIFSLPNLNLTTSEKVFLIVPILFPALSIFGMYVMNTLDNNIILISLLLLIPIYIVFVCLFNQKFPEKLYPAVIFSISISLLLLASLRSNHIIGVDTHQEYYYFCVTLDKLHWSVFGHSTLDACVSISLLPTIYQSILNISSEFLFKILYSLIFSISPLIIFVLSKRYIGDFYAFFASIFFMSQELFIHTTSNSRTITAISFFALAMMVLFSDNIGPLKKRFLFIVFIASCVVSHYSTTYIIFFTILGTFIGAEMLSRKYAFKKVVSLTIVILFFSMIFFWYSQVTEGAFYSGVHFLENTFISLNDMFVKDLRSTEQELLLGARVGQETIVYKIKFLANWATLALIGVGITTLLIRYKEMSFPELNFKKPEFLKDKFEVEYSMFVLACAGMLAITVAIPYISVGYAMGRIYLLAIVILSPFFVIGGVMLSKYFFFNRKNTSWNRAHLIILLVLIPFFFSSTGVIDAIFGGQQSIILTSEGKEYDIWYVHDQESYGAKWLESHINEKAKIYSDVYGPMRLLSQGGIHASFAKSLIEDKRAIKDGYIFLRYYNVVDGKVLGSVSYNITEYSDIFGEMNNVYANGGSEIWQ